MAQIVKLFRKWLFTGLLVWVPIFVTGYIIYWAFNTLDGWINWVNPLQDWIHFPRGTGVAVLLLGTLLLGFFVNLYVGRKMVALVDWVIEKVPAVNTIYRAIRDLSRTVFDRDSSALKEVVAIEFPHPGQWAIGFLTGEAPEAARHLAGEGREVVMVYVMQAFSPATGFLLAVPRDRIRKLDMPVEAAMKLIITGGIVRSGQ